MGNFTRLLRVAFVVGIGLILGVCGALAGDRALYNAIGYSKDLGYFAFEEFGIQDGSGLAYSNIYVLDVDNDHWVVGTPVQRVAEHEDEDLSIVRAAALDAAGDFITALSITVPAQLLAANGIGELNDDEQVLAFGFPGYIDPDAVRGEYKLSLEMFEASSGAPCMEWSGSKAKGFALTLDNQGMTREVHRDKNLPRSRSCPLAYSIAAVLAPYQSNDMSRAVALISVYKHGFEGPDRRVIAQPLAAAFVAK